MSPELSSDALERFRASMEIDYEKWHDGIGYDLDALEQASAEDRVAIERILVARGISDWRDVEALTALDTEPARTLLAEAGAHGTNEIRLAVARMAPQSIDTDQRTASLVHALETATIVDGLSAAIDQAADFHPPAVVDALLRGARSRPGEAAVHFAALLMFVHGITEEPFDWAERPFFLRFHATGAERWDVFVELCGRIGVDPQPFDDLPGD